MGETRDAQQNCILSAYPGASPPVRQWFVFGEPPGWWRIFVDRGGVMKTIAARDVFQPTVLLALALMAIIVMMILPMPAWVLDVGLAASFALAILIFTITLFIERPLDFSAFPTILLASLML